MKKDECEQAIRFLCHKWRADSGLSITPPGELNFRQFKYWVEQNYPQYLKFQTSTSVDFDIEMWFDQEFGQTWRR